MISTELFHTYGKQNFPLKLYLDLYTKVITYFLISVKNKQVIEARIPSGYAEVITSNDIRSPPSLGCYGISMSHMTSNDIRSLPSLG
jgi:hypothetical protein